MSRTLIATQKIAMNTGYNSLSWTAADSVNNMYYVDDGMTMLLAACGDVSSKTVTVVSVSDSLGRTGDVALTVPANNGTNDGVSAFGLPTGPAWRQAGTNQINVNISAATKLQLVALQVQRYS